MTKGTKGTKKVSFTPETKDANERRQELFQEKEIEFTPPCTKSLLSKMFDDENALKTSNMNKNEEIVLAPILSPNPIKSAPGSTMHQNLLKSLKNQDGSNSSAAK